MMAGKITLNTFLIISLIFLPVSYLLLQPTMVSAATYGNTGTGTDTDATNAYALCYNAGAFAGATGSTITSGSWRGADSTSPTTNLIEIGLYSNGSGVPGTRLTMISASITLTGTITTYAISDSDPYSLTNGTTYWICSASDTGDGWQTRFTAPATVDSSYQGTGVTTLPATWSETGVLGGDGAFYFNYSGPAAGGSPAVYKLQVPLAYKIEIPKSYLLKIN